MPTRLHSRTPVWDAVLSPHRLSLGLRRMATDECWLDLDEDLSADLDEKDRLFREHGPEVFVELPESREAQSEILEHLVSTLLEFYPDCYARTGDWLRSNVTGQKLNLRDSTRAPLELAARCVQEDLVVMAPGAQGWRLVAGAVCFPTRWALKPQLGRPMNDIHQRVPGYAEKLDETSNRFFDGMKSGDVFARGNWSLLDDPELHQPTGKMQTGRNLDISPATAGDEIWLRVEHQTLQRLPRTDSILFGIRIHRTRLRDIARNADASKTLIDAIETMNPAMQKYKSMERVREVAVTYLNAGIEKND